MFDKYGFSAILSDFSKKDDLSVLRTNVQNKRNSKTPDIKVISEQPKHYNLDDADVPEGRINCDIKSAHIEAFFKQGTSKELVVFFNGARTINQGRSLRDIPFFHRWNFHNYLDVSVLAISDPMYYTFPKCKLGWFFGTETDNYRELVAVFINSIAEKIQVLQQDIYLYGSSGGGTAAIEISRFLEKSNVIAINPQLDMDHYFYTKDFKNDVGISLEEYDLYGNNYDPTRTLTERKQGLSLIMTNIQSQHDFGSDLVYLCNKFNDRLEYGLNGFGNIYIWLYDAVGAPNPHGSQDSGVFMLAILTVVRALKNDEDIQVVKGYVRLLNELWNERFILMRQVNNLRKAKEQIEEELLLLKQEAD